MIKTKGFLEIENIPTQWIFEHFAKLDCKLYGQTVTILSPFKPEKTPSCKIFTNDNKSYAFCCFSSGKTGSAIDFVAGIFNISHSEAIDKIVKSYSGGYEATEFQEEIKFVVSDYKIRGWNESDAQYWSQFGISSKTLDDHCVKPLSEFTMFNGLRSFIRAGSNIYGYFRSDGVLYKIYQPLNKDKSKRFIQIIYHIQGVEFLKPNEKRILIICSSLKDAMAVKTLFPNIDALASDSESDYLNEIDIKSWKHLYEYVFVLFDCDQAGVNGMKEYARRYKILGLILKNYSKDLTDSLRDFNNNLVRSSLSIIIKNGIKKYQTIRNKNDKKR